MRDGEGLSFYAIAKRLGEEGHRWRKPDARQPRGYLLESWDHRRVERGYCEMRRIILPRLERANLPTESQNCVCFTETPLEHVSLLLGKIGDRNCEFKPYGIAIT